VRKMTPPATSQDFRIWRKLAGILRPFWVHTLALIGFNLLSTPLGLLSPLALKLVVDCYLGDGPIPRWLSAVLPGVADPKTEVLLAAIGLVLGISLGWQLQSVGSSLLRTYTGERLLLSVRAKMFQHVQRLSVCYHDKIGSSDSAFRLQSDTAAIRDVCLDVSLSLLSSSFTVLAMLYVTARIDWRVTMIAVTVGPALFLLSRYYRPKLRQQSREIKQLESSVWASVQEVLSAARLVKAFGQEDQERERYVKRSRDGTKARLRLAVAEGRYGFLVGLTTAAGTAAVLWMGASHVRRGLMTLGDLLLIMSYLSQLYEPMKTIGRKAGTLQGYLASAERVFSLLEQSPDVPERADAKRLVRARGHVEFRQVSFGYDPQNHVIHGISFTAPAGTRVGIAGRTGAGKTTLLSLLTRFFDPASGQILLDGIDLRDYKLSDLRSQFAIVLQEPVLFSTTIAENIAYARPGALEEEILTAAKLANAQEFIQRLPDGYQTLVGERGMRLSGGERQRIALARAFLKGAPILLLDEPTSSVDLKTEALIMEAMERLMHGRTTFIIAHRLNTLEHCNLRLELDHGRLINVSEESQPAAEQAKA
jgi:ATP-binding cassette subfamily B protein